MLETVWVAWSCDIIIEMAAMMVLTIIPTKCPCLI
jgi:hypothetical protein